jgi:hypothetical protein
VDDRELLQLAAKAYGIYLPNGCYESKYGLEVLSPRATRFWWHPLNNDGDALKLAVDLDIDVVFYREERTVQAIAILDPKRPDEGGTFTEGWGSDKLAATRRAIVRAAAAMADNQGGV